MEHRIQSLDKILRRLESKSHYYSSPSSSFSSPSSSYFSKTSQSAAKLGARIAALEHGVPVPHEEPAITHVNANYHYVERISQLYERMYKVQMQLAAGSCGEQLRAKSQQWEQLSTKLSRAGWLALASSSESESESESSSINASNSNGNSNSNSNSNSHASLEDLLRIEPVQRVQAACQRLNLSHARFYQTDNNYYSLSLDQRAQLLAAPSTMHLCKTLFLKNTAWKPRNQNGNETTGAASRGANSESSGEDKDGQFDAATVADPWNSKYYLVVVQYAAKTNSQALNEFVRSLLPPNERLSKNSYSLRFVDENETSKLLGFAHNGVCPIGANDSDTDIPILVAESVRKLSPSIIMLGGGDARVKLCLDMDELSSPRCPLANKTFVGSFTEERPILPSGERAEARRSENQANLEQQQEPSMKKIKENESVNNSSEPSLSSSIGASKNQQSSATGGTGGTGSAGGAGGAHFNNLDVRVGFIKSVEKVSGSDKLFCEHIDVGDDDGNPRQIVSGLQPFYSEDELHHSRCVVVCNLKPAKLAGLVSNGMVLCASTTNTNDNHLVKLLQPPKDAEIGSRIVVENSGDDIPDPMPVNQVKKKKVMENVASELSTDENGMARYRGSLLSVFSSRETDAAEGNNNSRCIGSGVPNGTIS